MRDQQHAYFTVPGDLKLELNINKSLKQQEVYVCIGASSHVSAAAECGLLFHKILEMTNFANKFIGNKSMGHPGIRL